MKKKKHPEHVNHERWLVSYADFITLLFAFFTTMYAISTVDQKKAGKLQYSMMTAFSVDFFPSKSGVAGVPNTMTVVSIDSPAIQSSRGTGGGKGKGKGKGSGTEAIAVLAAKLQDLATKKELKDRISIKHQNQTLVISLSEAGFFQSGATSISSEAMPALIAVAELVAVEQDHIEITIEGHTDNVPMKIGSNWALSASRATSVLELLLSRGFVDPQHVSAAGYGEHRPIALNTTADGRARNRRVDLVARLRSSSGG